MFSNTSMNYTVSFAQLRDGLFLTVITEAAWSPIVPSLLGSPSPLEHKTFLTDDRLIQWLGEPQWVTLAWLDGEWKSHQLQGNMSPQPLKLDAKVNVPNSLILIGQVYLSGVWLGVDIITDTKITCA